jgi:hypothetical protein
MSDYGRKTVGITGNTNSSKTRIIHHSKLKRRAIYPFTSEKETVKLNKIMGNNPCIIALRKT